MLTCLPSCESSNVAAVASDVAPSTCGSLAASRSGAVSTTQPAMQRRSVGQSRVHPASGQAREQTVQAIPLPSCRTHLSVLRWSQDTASQLPTWYHAPGGHAAFHDMPDSEQIVLLCTSQGQIRVHRLDKQCPRSQILPGLSCIAWSLNVKCTKAEAAVVDPAGTIAMVQLPNSLRPGMPNPLDNSRGKLSLTVPVRDASSAHALHQLPPDTAIRCPDTAIV